MEASDLKFMDTEAEEDMDLYKSMLANLHTQVIDIRNNGLFNVFGNNSDEYFEHKLGHAFDTTGNSYVDDILDIGDVVPSQIVTDKQYP